MSVGERALERPDMDSDGDNALGRDGAEEQEREDQGEDINARE